jgi:tetratricopeptide (TPR) repeat protein
MKKNLFYSILVGFVGLFSVGCGDEYLAYPPSNSITLEEFISTPEDAQAVLNSAYKALSHKDALGGNTQFLGELMADNISAARIQGDWLAHYTWTTDIFLGTTRNLMAQSFRVAGRANFLLDNMNLVTGLSEAEKTRMRGEALFLRAIPHFECVRFFGQPYGYTSGNTQSGIAIRTAWSKDLVNRSSVGEVYNQIIADLNEAITLLPESQDIYADKWAAKGYLAKVYFQMNDFQKAYDLANDVINNGGFSMEADLMKRFNTSASSETIFETVSVSLGDESNNGFRDNFRPDPSTGLAAAYISNDMFVAATANPDDLRTQQWYVANTMGNIECTKFPITTYTHVPIVHLTEMKLIRAEAAAELGNTTTAFQDINDIRTRAGVGEVPAGTTTSDLITIIRNERRLELVGEGNRLHELKRQAVRNRPDLKIRGIAPWDCNGMVCQIPDNELRGNPDMEPNPTGGCQ